jgi:hypothetical protein
LKYIGSHGHQKDPHSYKSTYYEKVITLNLSSYWPLTFPTLSSVDERYCLSCKTSSHSIITSRLIETDYGT